MLTAIWRVRHYHYHHDPEYYSKQKENCSNHQHSKPTTIRPICRCKRLSNMSYQYQGYRTPFDVYSQVNSITLTNRLHLCVDIRQALVTPCTMGMCMCMLGCPFALFTCQLFIAKYFLALILLSNVHIPRHWLNPEPHQRQPRVFPQSNICTYT